jgi:hypothetical protein
VALSVVFQKDADATPQVGVSVFSSQRRCLGQCPLVKVSEGAGEVVQRATENTNVVIVTKVSGQKGLSRLVLQVSAQVCLTKPAPQMPLFLAESWATTPTAQSAAWPVGIVGTTADAVA